MNISITYVRKVKLVYNQMFLLKKENHQHNKKNFCKEKENDFVLFKLLQPRFVNKKVFVVAKEADKTSGCSSDLQQMKENL